MNKNIELLAPVGDLSCAISAINAGADAIYVGGHRFGARAFAETAKDEEGTELEKIIKIAHAKNKKVYLTTNTLIKNNELNDALEYIKYYNEKNVDAFIVQDLGLAFSIYEYNKTANKKIKIHASTQMNIVSSQSILLLRKLGINKFILARELNINEIENIIKNVKEVDGEIEFECFIHGSMCYSYSGMCLMSSFLGGNSGNRGRCKGTCRLKYKYNNKEAYYLSMKDMCSLNYIQKLISIGINSFKIEGRMRNKYYVAGATSIYRKYIDLVLKNQSFDEKEKAKDEILLNEVYDKAGFTNYYEKHNDKSMIQLVDREKRIVDNKVLESLYKMYIDTDYKIKLNLNIYINYDNTKVEVFDNKEHKIIKEYEIIAEKSKNIATDKNIILNKIKKTNDIVYEFDKVNIFLEDENNMFIPMDKLNVLRRKIINENYLFI